MRYKVEDVNKVDYEFECEALADFTFGIDSKTTNKVAEESLMDKFKQKLYDRMEKKDVDEKDGLTMEEAIKYV